MITSGIDLWINTPLPLLKRLEQAVLNGIPSSLSIMDGWWIESYIKDVKVGLFIAMFNRYWEEAAID